MHQANLNVLDKPFRRLKNGWQVVGGGGGVGWGEETDDILAHP